MTNINNQDFRDRPINSNQTSTSQASRVNQTDLEDGMVQRPAARSQTAYQDGYRQGQYTEQRNSAERRAVEDESAASGLIFGLLLAALTGLGLGTYFYLAGQNRAPQVMPSVTAPSPVASPSPQVKERIIERDRVVPVPQQAPSSPNVNITLPNPAPENRVTQPAPQPQTQAPATNNSTTTAPTQSGQ